MENLDQEPEEIPMDEVLSEIRRMLLKDTENQTVASENFVSNTEEKSVIQPDYFLLTPEMRCDIQTDNRAETVKLQTKKLLTKLQENKTDEKLSPELVDWLNTHLPDMIEKAISKKIAS